MAQCSQSAREFIQNTFGPTVAVVCSHDAEVLVQKNNLSFVEMVRPFCRLTSEAHIRDPSGQMHSIHNLRIVINEMNTQLPSLTMHKKICHDAVQNSQLPTLEGQGNVVTVGGYDLEISASTPWYETYREAVLQNMATSDHEFIRHFVACMLVVSTEHADPLDQFAKLSQQQHQLQHSSNTPHPKWLCPNIFKYFVLLHDNSEGEEEKADAIYQSMKSTYGSHACHLLRINSRVITTVDTGSMPSEQTSMPDPWSQYLNKVNQQDSADVDVGPASDLAVFPDQVMEGTETGNASMVLTPGSSEDGPNDPSPDDIVMVQVEGSSSNDIVSHPLANLEMQSKHNDLNSQKDPLSSPMDPLSTPTDPLSTPTDPVSTPIDPLLKSKIMIDTIMVSNANGSNSLPTKGSNQVPAGTRTGRTGPGIVHGAHLTLSDHDRLRIFIHEFVVRGLLPYVERMIRTLSEQLASRKGIQRSLFNATKKLFMGKQNEKMLTAPVTDSPPKYLRESPEVQMRRRADLAFMVQMYELAYTSYHTAKGDFGNDQAWLYYAGSLEFAAISAYMLGHMQKAYPTHYMENAITTYLTTCRQPQLATRAVLLGTEIQKARCMFSEAAQEFIRLTGEDSDLRSALFLEQAAHCFVHTTRPMVRKYAFHMILAGHRFSKAGQRRHALRAYCQALQVYRAKGWALAEDHINLTVGRQSFNLRQLENATAAFRHLLARDSRQSAVQQAAFLREYLGIFKQQLLGLQSTLDQAPATLPGLPLPFIKKSATRILLASTQKAQYSDNRILATSVTFGRIFDPAELHEWCALEETVALVASKQKSLPSWFQYHPQLLHNGTDNSSSPVAIIGEPMTVELVLENPLKIPVVLTNIMLLWEFLPVNYEGGNQENPERQPEVLSNHAQVEGKMSGSVEDVVKVECIPEVILAANDYKLLHLGLTPFQTGELHIVGVAYSLSPQLPNQGTDPPSSTNNQEVLATTDPNSKPGGIKRPASLVTCAGGSGSAQVLGMQDLNIQGPRLNETKAERCGVAYGADRRLDPIIAAPMPLLEVIFSSMPSSLLCGEICKVTMEIINKGVCPLHKLHTISDRPDILSFGGHIHQFPTNSSSQSLASSSSISSDSGQSGHNNHQTKRTLPLLGGGGGGDCVIHEVEGSKCNVSSVTEIILPGGCLAPGASLSVPLWFRGPDESGLHDFRMLFYYETTQENIKIRHRTLQHVGSLQTSNSVSLSARADRAHTVDGSRRGKVCHDFVDQGSPQDPSALSLIMSLTVENMNQVHDSNIMEISLQHVTGVSSRWHLSPLAKHDSDLRVGSGESQKLCFKATQSGSRDRDVVMFSSVLFGSDKSVSDAMPCADFYLRSHLKGGPTGTNGSMGGRGAPGVLASGQRCTQQLQECNMADLALLVMWKAFLVDEDGGDHTLYGQSHLLIDQVSMDMLSHPVRKLPVEQKQLKFVKKPVSPEPALPSPEIMSSLIKYSLQYTEAIRHDFSKNRICSVPVTLTLCNCTDSPLNILVETTSAIELDSSTAPVAQSVVGGASPPCSGFSWVGQASRHLPLATGQECQLALLSCCSQPGVYDLLAGLRVSAAPPAGLVPRPGTPPLTPQQRLSPCLLSVTDCER